MPTAGGREFRRLPRQASHPSRALLGPCQCHYPDSPLLPKALSLAMDIGSGTGKLSLCRVPITTWGSVALRAGQPGEAPLGPRFGDLRSTPGLQVRRRGIAVTSRHPNLSDPTQRCCHLAAPAPLVCGWGHRAEILQHGLAPVLCPALAFLFREQRPGGPCRTEKG